MKKTLMFLFVAIFTIGLVGCGKKSESQNAVKKVDPIIGSWDCSGFVYTFNEDKTCTYAYSDSKMECTYEIEGDKLSIFYEDATVPFETTFKIEEDKLIIKDSLDEDVIYKRK